MKYRFIIENLPALATGSDEYSKNKMNSMNRESMVYKTNIILSISLRDIRSFSTACSV
jgi:hypothetical protein